VGDQVRIGYSFWGFLGPGITDTPDGGRPHRRVLIDGLLARGHEIVFLQANRDLDEAGLDLTGHYTWDQGLPPLDALMLEWRWPIPDRNTIICGTPGHTCDLHRQQQLVDYYTEHLNLPTALWDKDRQLPPDDALRRRSNVTVCEAAIHPSPGAISLLFPVADRVLDTADAKALAALPRELSLVYIGNQYDRDDAFDTFFAPVAAKYDHLVVGKWTRTERWPHVRFAGRIPFPEVENLYTRAHATVLLLPDRYAATGQMTQRLFEAVLAGCLPLTPDTIRSAKRFTPPALHISGGTEAAFKIEQMRRLAGTARHAQLIAACLRRLDIFRLSRQLAVLDQLLAQPSRLLEHTAS
jgi:hypothetical protein